MQRCEQLAHNPCVEVTGFWAAKIDSLILEGDGGGENEDVLPDRPKPPVSRPGDATLVVHQKRRRQCEQYEAA